MAKDEEDEPIHKFEGEETKTLLDIVKEANKDTPENAEKRAAYENKREDNIMSYDKRAKEYLPDNRFKKADRKEIGLWMNKIILDHIEELMGDKVREAYEKNPKKIAQWAMMHGIEYYKVRDQFYESWEKPFMTEAYQDFIKKLGESATKDENFDDANDAITYLLNDPAHKDGVWKAADDYYQDKHGISVKKELDTQKTLSHLLAGYRGQATKEYVRKAIHHFDVPDDYGKEDKKAA